MNKNGFKGKKAVTFLCLPWSKMRLSGHIEFNKETFVATLGTQNKSKLLTKMSTIFVLDAFIKILTLMTWVKRGRGVWVAFLLVTKVLVNNIFKDQCRSWKKIWGVRKPASWWCFANFDRFFIIKEATLTFIGGMCYMRNSDPFTSASVCLFSDIFDLIEKSFLER